MKPLLFGNEGVEVSNLLGGLGLWEVYLGDARANGGGDIGFGIGAVYPDVDFGAALLSVGYGVLDEGAGEFLLGLGNGVLEVEVEVVAVARP